MGKLLIIAEKPSVARDIAAALKGFKKVDSWLESDTAIVSSGIGHLVELHVPQAQTSGRDLTTLPIIPQQFELKPVERTKAQFNILKRLMARKDVDAVVNACDAGREGELIFRLIYEHAGCTKPMKRMWLQSMTSDAIQEAFRDMREGREFDALADAAKCRSEADWLIGINGSRGITKLHDRLNGRSDMMSAGRVQTPTLAILVNRENEIRNFVPQDYWEIHGTFGAQAGTYIGKWFNPKAAKADKSEKAEEGEDAQASGYRVNDRAQAEAIIKKCKGVAPSSVKDTSRNTQVPPPKLFDLTTLQREANKRFKFSAQKTLDLAQSLYEKHKALSYPRTDSSALPEDYVGKAAKIMGSLKADADFSPHAQRVIDNAWVKKDKRIFDNSKISDHFAIIPTGTRPVSLTPDEARLYEMVVQRFMAAFHPAAEYANTTRITTLAGEQFKSTGRVLLKQGWQEVYGKSAAPAAADKAAPALVAVAPGEQVSTKSMALKTLQTKPPARLTEASLLAAMETAGKLVDDEDLRDAMKARGLGTPATRAATIEGLLKDKDGRGHPKEPYVRREGKERHLVPTPKGAGLIQFLDSNGIEALTSPRMTGEWEQKLLAMEKGGYQRAAFMAEIADMTRSILDTIRGKAGALASAYARSAPAGASPAATPQALPAMAAPNAPCPRCGSALAMDARNGRTVNCQSERCGFRIWRTVAGKVLGQKEIDALLTSRATPVLEGFTSRAGRPFSAALELKEDGDVSFVFADRAPAVSRAPAAVAPSERSSAPGRSGRSAPGPR